MDQATMIGKVLDETNRVVDGIEPSQLDNPSPCDEWTVRDVLNHITGGRHDVRGVRARRFDLRRAAR